MTSRGIIMTLCWVVIGLYFMSDIFPVPYIPMAFCASFLLMELLGMFKKELAKAVAVKDERTQRQIDFQRSLEEGKANSIFEDQEDEPVIEARIYTVDEDGNESFVIIKADGTVETEGNPDPDIIEAVSGMQDAIREHGPSVIAEELSKQLEKIEQEKHK